MLGLGRLLLLLRPCGRSDSNHGEQQADPLQRFLPLSPVWPTDVVPPPLPTSENLVILPSSRPEPVVPCLLPDYATDDSKAAGLLVYGIDPHSQRDREEYVAATQEVHSGAELKSKKVL